MLLAVQNGVDVTAQNIIPLVEEQMQNDIKQLFEVAPDDLVRQLVGKDKLKSLRKQSLKKAPPVPLKKSVKDVGSTRTNDKEQQKQTFKQFFGV